MTLTLTLHFVLRTHLGLASDPMSQVKGLALQTVADPITGLQRDPAPAPNPGGGWML